MPWLVIGALAFIAFIIITQSNRQASLPALAKALRPVVGLLVGGVALLALAREQILPAAVLAIGALILTGAHKTLWGRRSGSSSDMGPVVEMVRDAESGALDGQIRRGRFVGRRLSELSLEQIRTVHEACARADPDLLPSLESSIEGRFGKSWRDRRRSADNFTAMSRTEALEVLGLKEGATEAEIKAAYHRLMLKLHPDQGGSTYLATQLNRAKTALLS